MGFGFFTWMVFGVDMVEFNTFSNSFYVCLNYIIGNPPDFNDLLKSNRVLAPMVSLFFSSPYILWILRFIYIFL